MPDQARAGGDGPEPEVGLPKEMLRALLRYLPPGQRPARTADADALRMAIAVARTRMRRKLLAEEWRDD